MEAESQYCTEQTSLNAFIAIKQQRKAEQTSGDTDEGIEAKSQDTRKINNKRSNISEEKKQSKAQTEQETRKVETR